MEKFYFMMDYYNITQGYNSKCSTHKGRKALDICGKDSGKDEIYAPFTGTIKAIYARQGHATTCWFCSDDEVLCADGSVQKMTIMFTHPEEIFKFKVGQKFKQGQAMMKEGKTGGATGNHLDFEIAKGTITSWYKNKYGYYTLTNSVDPCTYIIMKDYQIVINEIYKGTKYHFKKERELIKVVSGVPSEPLYVRDKCSKIVDKLYNKDKVFVFSSSLGKSKVYKNKLGYTYSKFLK